MQKNYWEKIAKMFNLKLYERFTIIRPEDRKWDPACKYYFHDSGLTVILPDGKEEKTLQELFELINGKSQVVLSRFVPTVGDEYWYIMEDGLRLSYKRWEHSTADKVRLYTHNCFRSKKEADYNDKSYRDKLNEYYKTVYDATYVQEESEDTDEEENLD